MGINFVSISNKLYFNKFTKAGKKRKELAEMFEDCGCKIIRERKSKRSTVILGYKNEYVPLANYAAKIVKDGSFEYKYSNAVYSQIPSSDRYYKIWKVIVDSLGNTKIFTKKLSIIMGKVAENYTNCTFYEA